MKLAIGYARISNEDQSNFSIEGQIEQFEDYAARNDMQLIETFTDDGESAKNFERKSWRRLVEFLKLNHTNIDYIIVFKYDRFSRNIHEALGVIHELEETYKIRIISISEPIALPPESPFYFQLRAQILLQAHVERLVISDRTKFGMNKARKEGRYMGLAPYGYVNARDKDNKPVIEVVPDEARVVEKIFELHSIGLKPIEIRKRVSKMGFNRSGNDAIYRILKNPVYCGLINHPSKKGYIEAVHQPIIPKQLFFSIQEDLRRPGRVYKKYNDYAYLKGAIYCNECHRPLTCGRSKGKLKYYWYYECSKHRKSFSVEKLNSQFDNILDELSFTPDQLEYIQSTVSEMLKKHLKDMEVNLPLKFKQKEEVYTKLVNLEDKYFSGKIDDDTFNRWSTKYKEELEEIDTEINIMTRNQDSYWKRFKSHIKDLQNIRSLFHKAKTEYKFAFVETVFGKGLVYADGMYRTPYLNPVFAHKLLILKRKELIEVYKKTGFQKENPLWVADGIRTHDFQNHNLTL